MKTNTLYLLSPNGRSGGFPYLRLVVISMLIALIFASFRAASVLAAPASAGSPPVSDNLAQAWQNKIQTLRYQGMFYDRIRLYPTDFDQPSDLALVHFYLEKYGVALKAANTVALNHTGFDVKGHVINEEQADKSIRDLAMYLQMMRGLREKMEDVPSRSKYI